MLGSISNLLHLTHTRLRTSRVEGPTPPHIEEASNDACRSRMLDVLGRHSRLAGQTHALSRDRWRVLWSSGQRAFIAFHERPFTLIAWRDPVGPRAAQAEALTAFRDYARARGKQALIIAASAEATAAGAREGFASTWIGGEQRFDLAAFHTRGKLGAKLRLAMNHARRNGAVAREIDPVRDGAHLRALEATEAAWKAGRAARRNRSFLRTEPMENAGLRRYFAVERAVDGGTRFESLLVCAPVSGRGWYLQDLVRRPDAPRGAAELVSVRALETLAQEGFEFATMGIVPLFDPHGAQPRSSSQAVVRCAIGYFDRLYRFAGLQQFRAKFAATSVEPMHVLYWPKVLTPFAVWDAVSVLSR